MENITVLIKTLTEYIAMLTSQPTWLDIFIEKIIPVVQFFTVILGGGFALYKYQFEKNREVNEKILKEVYAPLYGYFVKQELYCHMFSNINYKERPICDLTEVKTKTVVSVEGVHKQRVKEVALGLGRQEFLKVLDSVNCGLASKELYTLLNMYKTIIYLEEHEKKGSPKQIKASMSKIDIENALRKEIISGYKLYYDKLKLLEITKNNFYKITEENIEFTYKLDDDLFEEKLEEQQENN